MEVKFIVKNMTDQFYSGFGDFVGFNNLSDFDKYGKLKTLSADLPKNIKQKECQFNKMLELNILIKSGLFNCKHSVSPRRGYKVHTFTFTAS